MSGLKRVQSRRRYLLLQLEQSRPLKISRPIREWKKLKPLKLIRKNNRSELSKPWSIDYNFFRKSSFRFSISRISRIIQSSRYTRSGRNPPRPDGAHILYCSAISRSSGITIILVWCGRTWVCIEPSINFRIVAARGPLWCFMLSCLCASRQKCLCNIDTDRSRHPILIMRLQKPPHLYVTFLVLGGKLGILV